MTDDNPDKPEDDNVYRFIPQTEADVDWIRAARWKKAAEAGDEEAARKYAEMESTKVEWVSFWEYCKLVGTDGTDSADGTVYGLIRHREPGEYERFDKFKTMDWKDDPEGLKYFCGINDSAVQILESEAVEIIEDWRKASNTE